MGAWKQNVNRGMGVDMMDARGWQTDADEIIGTGAALIPAMIFSAHGGAAMRVGPKHWARFLTSHGRV
jgi:hypothetical protein